MQILLLFFKKRKIVVIFQAVSIIIRDHCLALKSHFITENSYSPDVAYTDSSLIRVVYTLYGAAL